MLLCRSNGARNIWRLPGPLRPVPVVVLIDEVAELFLMADNSEKDQIARHRAAALHLVLDNYATHKTPAIHQWLLKHPRFHLHFTPASSSWLNLVERWFAELTNRKLRRSAHRSVTELETDIRKWINEWNKNPKPFVWTKTADEILETIAEYCQRISAPASQPQAANPKPG